jgi:hypothetical protein
MLPDELHLGVLAAIFGQQLLVVFDERSPADFQSPIAEIVALPHHFFPIGAGLNVTQSPRNKHVSHDNKGKTTMLCPVSHRQYERALRTRPS